MALRYLRFAVAVALLSPIVARANTPEQIFVQVSPSVVVVDIFDATGKSVGQGSGVVIGKGQVITNCHVAQKGKALLIRQSAWTTSADDAAPSVPSLKDFLEKARPLNPGISDGDLTQYWKRTYDQVLSSETFNATLQQADPYRDLCQLHVPDLQAPPVVMGTAIKLRIGQRVYAIGAPQGLELTLSEGLISGLRRYEGSHYIQTSAPISPGSSGGGLFDDQGRLIGITSFQLIEGQNLNFALPVEWIGELPKRTQTAPVEAEQTGLDLFKRAVALHQAKDWQNLLVLSRQWVKSEQSSADAYWFLGLAHYGLKEYDQEIRFKRESLRIDPENSLRWLSLGATYDGDKQYEPAAEAYRQVIRLEPENADIWGILGFLYADRLKQYDQAVQAYREVVRIHPEDYRNWSVLGLTYSELKQYDQAIKALRQAVRIQPNDAYSWMFLGKAYLEVRQYDKAIQAYQEVIRVEPASLSAWYKLGTLYSATGNRDKMVETYQTIKKLHPETAEKYFNEFILRSTSRD